jgi:DNA gyrase/topoisomerase IV subunit B
MRIFCFQGEVIKGLHGSWLETEIDEGLRIADQKPGNPTENIAFDGDAITRMIRVGERTGILDRIEAEKKKGKVTVTRFKGLGEMDPEQLRETTMNRDTRRLVQLTVSGSDKADQMMDMLLAKKRAKDRRTWLETKGNLAEV